jgi:hypothetical protein
MSDKKQELHPHIQDAIVNGTFHKNYKRTCDLAVRYKQLLTGHDIDSLLHQFVKREDEQMFGQRKRLTQAITPAVTAAVVNPFYKVGRTNNIAKKINFTTDQVGKTEKINKAIDNFWGNKSLEQYLQTRYTEISFCDPNAFIIVEFDQKPDKNGNMTEVPSPRAFEVFSENVVNFKHENNILEWVLIQLPISYIEEEKKIPGKVYTIYGSDWALKYTQISIKGKESVPLKQFVQASNEKGESIILYRASEAAIFIVNEYNHKSKEVPAIRVGYKADLVTDGETCVNPFHDGMAYLMKSIKTVSEFDLTMSLHTFPQKFMYAPRCMGESNQVTCDGGMTPDGKMCHKCQGTGLAIHTSAQDAIIMRLPKEKDSMMDLDKLVYYAQPPIDIVKFQNEYITQLKQEFFSAVFNSELLAKNEVAQTATGENIDLQNIYDTLFPYAEHYSDVFKHVTKVSCYFIDIEDASVVYKFPKDFKFRSVDALLDQLKKANDSNAPGYVREELSLDLMDAQFIDKPDELVKIKVKNKFFPFSDKTDVEILFIISNGLTNKYKEVLWANFGDIFTEIESDPALFEFYTYSFVKQKEIIDGKVKLIQDELAAAAPPAALPFGQTA